MKLGLVDYFNYLTITEHARCISEGEAVLNAGHIILCGKTSDNPLLEVFALCLQTSALSAEPHQIKGAFNINEEQEHVQIDSFQCSCKAGMSGRCKHISAVLLWCTRQSLEDLEVISQTDIKCVWSTQRHTTREQYKAVPVKDMPCLSTKCVTFNNEHINDDILRTFSENLPNSALSLHRTGRRILQNIEQPINGFSTVKELNEKSIRQQIVLDNACQSVLMLELSTIPFNFRLNCCENMFSKLFGNCDVNSVINTNQNTNIWRRERQFRVTGSRVYELYTYSKDDWQRKAVTYFWPKKFTNKYIRHGLAHETEARTRFCESFSASVEEYGLVVSHSNLWLGYSPDGILFHENVPVALLEIKCIFSGADKPISEAIKLVNYVEQEVGGAYKLKKKHKYYGQVQLGMSILNLRQCYFVVYASHDKSFEVIQVPFDEIFCRDMLFKVKNKFFHEMWHHLCLNNGT